MTTFRVGSASHVGQVRAKNDDSALVSEAAAVYAVADGMGGHRGGDVASAIAVETLEALVTEPTTDGLVEAVKEANRRIFDRAGDDEELRGMGTTLVAIALVDAEVEEDGEEVAWVNVGDSRVYLFRDGELRQLSRDHSLIEDLRRGGQLSDEEAAVHPQRNILTRALGIDREVEVDHDAVLHLEGDRFLLCSDGLFNEVDEDTIVATLTDLEDPAEAVTRLVELANDGGGRDNITCVVADVTDDGGRSAAAATAAAAAAAAAAARADGDATGSDDTDAVDEAATPTVELPPVDPDDPAPDDPAPDHIDPANPTDPTVETAPVAVSDEPATPPAGSPVPPPPPSTNGSPGDDGATTTSPAAGPPPPPPPDDPDLGTSGVVVAAAAGSATADEDPGRPPADGPFPTPSDPGFPGEESAVDDEHDDDGLPFGRGERGLYEDMDAAGGRHWALTLLGVVVVLGVLGFGGYKGLEWYANRTFFLDTDGDEVVIRRGQPDGFLVFDPTISERTDRTLDDLQPEVRDDVEARREFSSASNARSHVNNGTLPAEDRDDAGTTTEPDDPGTTEPDDPGTTEPDDGSTTTETPTTTEGDADGGR